MIIRTADQYPMQIAVLMCSRNLVNCVWRTNRLPCYYSIMEQEALHKFKMLIILDARQHAALSLPSQPAPCLRILGKLAESGALASHQSSGCRSSSVFVLISGRSRLHQRSRACVFWLSTVACEEGLKHAAWRPPKWISFSFIAMDWIFHSCY